MIGAALIAGSAFFRSWEVSKSVGVGVVFSLLNFWLLIRIVEGLREGLSEAGAVQVGWLAAKFLLKLALSGIVLWWVVTQSGIAPMPFIAGLSCSILPIIGIGLGVNHARV